MSSEEEKRVEQARKTVSAQKALKPDKNTSKPFERKRPAPFPPPFAPAYPQPYSYGQPQAGTYGHYSMPYSQPVPYAGASVSNNTPQPAYNPQHMASKAKQAKAIPRCWGCGSEGHFMSQCPNPSSQSSYPPPMLAPGQF